MLTKQLQNNKKKKKFNILALNSKRRDEVKGRICQDVGKGLI